jgi:tetratricopeptide (TPR) repeat protein
MAESRDFFISYNTADRAWAEWIAWQVETAGYTTIIQAWDFRAGTNFVSLMHNAATIATRTIAVLSPDYLNDAPYSEAEWSAAFAQDPTGKNGTLLPVRVRECNPPGLLKAIVYIDLVKLDETAAHSTLLTGIQRTRAKPARPPQFPNASSPTPGQTSTPNFPGQWPLKWNIPYGRNPYFTGRETLLQSLHDQLINGNTMALTQAQAISGLGGIGKTQTALEYAHRHQHQYRFILWISAVTLESLLSDLSKLADLLEVPGRDPQNQQNTASAVKDYLVQQRDWLLIFDNADDIEMVREYLPRGNKTNGHILLTTRAQALGTVAHAVRVKEMDKGEGTQLLLKRGRLLKTGQLLAQMGASNRTVAESLVEAVGGLPLALDQAAAYIEETGCSLSDYLKLYKTRHQDLLKRRGRLVTDHPETVAATWSLSFQKVEQENKAAAELLRLCAFLAPDAIPEEIISEGASHLGKILAPVAADPLYLNDAIGVLRKYSLVKRDPETKTLSIHRLVQQVLKDGMNEKVQRQWAERAVRALSQVFPFGWDVENWPQCRRLLAQAQICAELIEEYGLVFADAARLLIYCGFYLYKQALYGLAEPFFRSALSIAGKLDKLEYPRTYDAQHGLAILYQDQGKYKEAEELYRQALTTREKVLGKEHPDTAAAQHELARLYEGQGKYKEAEELYRQALTTREKVGKEHPNTAATQSGLATLYQAQRRYKEAEELYREALATREKVSGKEHPDTAGTQHELGRLYQAQGKYEEAEELYREALATYEKVLGREHPNTVNTLQGLALIYRTRGQYKEAEAIHQHSLRVYEQKFGSNHPDTILALEHYASLLRTMGRTTEAEALESRIKPQKGKIMSDQHISGESPERRIALVMLIDDAERLLLQLRDAQAPTAPGKWGLPGGGIEPGETPEEAACRELLEEAGLRVEGALMLRWHGMLQSASQPGAYNEYFVFAASTSARQEDVILGEGDAMVFTPLNEARKLDLSASAQYMLSLNE